MSRKLLIISGTVIAVQMAGFVFFGTSPAGSWISNSTQLIANALAIVFCWQASRRAQGIARPFWAFFASAFTLWFFGNLLFTYYDSWLKVTVPSPSLSYFLTDCYGAPLLMALYLDEDSSRFDLPQFLDSLQVLILFGFLYVYLFYLPFRHAGAGPSLVADQIYVSNFKNWFLVIAYLFRSRMTRSSRFRGLLQRVSIYLVVYAIGASIANYGSAFRNASTGNWYDLSWTVPFLLAAYLASGDQQVVESESPAPARLSLFGLLATNLSPALIPALVMILATQVAPEARVVTSGAILATLLCFGARVAVTQLEQRKSHDLLKAVTEGIDDAVFVKDSAGRYLMINSAGARMFARSVPEVIGKDDTELLSLDTARLMMEGDRRVMRSGEILTHEEVGTVAGITRTYLSTKGPYRNHSGEIVGLLGISRDISERKRAEEAQLRQALAMEAAVDGMAILNQHGEYLYLNRSHVKLFGYQSPADLLGKSWRVLYGREEVARFEGEILPILARDGRWAGEVIAQRQDGSKFPQELALTAMIGGEMICVCRDITARKREEEARIEAETYYRTLVEQLAAVTYIAELGAQGKWLYVSPQVESIIGYSATEWLADSRNWIHHVHEDDRAGVLSAEEACQRGNAFRAEYRIITRDGRTIWVNDTGVLVPGSGGKPPLMHGVMLDVTERRHLEERLLQSQKMEAVGQLAGGVAHDFNNLLTIIKGYASVLYDDLAGTPALQPKLEAIDDAAERAAELTRQLLAFSRKQVLQPQVIDLNVVLRDTDKMLRRLIGENIEIRLFPGANLGTVKVDVGQIEQVIMNLAVNARDAMPEGGKLTLETANSDLDASYAGAHEPVKPGKYVQLAVSDTGVGINPKDRPHIFEPFFTTKARGKGTGLGLSMVYGIVKQSGGYVWVYSEPGHGTAFKIYLPRVDEESAPVHKQKIFTPGRQGTETILLVEDDEPVRELAHMILSRCGYQVLPVARMEDLEAICRAHAGTIHLLLTDVIMPGMSGREVARRITALRPSVKVVYMSGYTDDAIVHHGVLDPGTLFLQKPFTPTSLAEKIREALDGTGNDSSD